MKYIYLGDRLTDPDLKGKKCDPVLRFNGKCITGRSKMMVVFENGIKHVVLRYRLRKIKEQTNDSKG